MGLTLKIRLVWQPVLIKTGSALTRRRDGIWIDRDRYRHATSTASNDKPRLFRLVDAEGLINRMALIILALITS